MIRIVVVTAWLLIIAQTSRAQGTHIGIPRNAHAEDIVLSTMSVIDAACLNCAPAFSPKGTYISYIEKGAVISSFGPAAQSAIDIVEIPSLRRVKRISMEGPICRAVWSPDETHLLAVDPERNGTIVDVASGRRIPIGILPIRSCNSESIIWTGPEEIVFYNTGWSWEFWRRFDLETLSAAPLIASSAEITAVTLRLNASPREHPNIALTTISTPLGGTSVMPSIVVTNKDGSFGRVLLEAPYGQRMFSPDAAYAMVIGPYAGHDNCLCLLILGAGKPTRTEITATITPLPAAPDPQEVSHLISSLSQGDTLTASIFKARRNPLNDRIVGTEGLLKSRMRLLSIGGNAIRGRLTLVIKDPEVGDVVMIGQLRALISAVAGKDSSRDSAIGASASVGIGIWSRVGSVDAIAKLTSRCPVCKKFAPVSTDVLGACPPKECQSTDVALS